MKIDEDQKENYQEWISQVAFMMSPYILIKNKTRESKFKRLFKERYSPNQAVGFWVLANGKL